MRNLLHHIVDLPAKLIVRCIGLYQHTLSPDHGPLRHLYTYGYCRHSPTCSQYTIQMIEKRGAIIGSLLGLKRILTCNPFTKLSDEKLMELTKKTL